MMTLRKPKHGGRRRCRRCRRCAFLVVTATVTALAGDLRGTTTTSAGPLVSAFLGESLSLTRSPSTRLARSDRDPLATKRSIAPSYNNNNNNRGADADTTTTSRLFATMDFEDMTVLNDLVVASSLSYLSSEAPEDGSVSSASSSKMEASPYSSKHLKPIVQVVDPKTESGATIFEYSRADGDDETTIVVACRGSATPVNLLTNIRFKLVPLESGKDTNPSFLVHQGFQDATNGLWKLLHRELNDLVGGSSSSSSSSSSASRVVFTGHSLGAANALLCAIRYSESSSSLPLEGVITFGGPRLVNTALADHWNDRLQNADDDDDDDSTSNVWVRNYVHDRDPILRQNGPLWDALGFGIVGKEVPCEPYKLVAYHSREQQQRQQQQQPPLAWNILDHCNYLGVFVGPRLV